MQENALCDSIAAVAQIALFTMHAIDGRMCKNNFYLN